MKALISMRWETGSRIAELLNLRIENVEPTDKYAAMIVNGKTGMRRVVIIFAWPYLMQWLNMHPKKDDPSAPVWIQRNGGPLSYPDVRKRLQILAKKAKVKKPVNPHMFRHSRATFLAQHLTESQLSQYFGWIQGSRMPATYVYMSGKDLIPHLLKLNGLEEENLTGAT